jgi:hypothetical protein
MSVTFSIENAPISWTISCGCRNTVSKSFATYTEAAEARDSGAVVLVCEDEYCAAFGYTVCGDDIAPTVNFSNSNAALVLDNLGWMVGSEFEDRCFGSITGVDLLGRVLMATAVNIADMGVPAYAEGSPNFINCGRPEGYLDVRLAQLEELAVYAKDFNSNVVWA